MRSGKTKSERRGYIFAAVIIAVGFASTCLARDEQISARELVNRAMQAQVAAQSDTSRFEYLQKRLDKRDTRTYRIVESDAGDVEWMIAVNDQDLAPKQREKEEQWLEKLLADPTIQKDREKDDAAENGRRQKIISVLGRAFLYGLQGTENDGRIVRLHFRPNPQFHSDSREAKVCAGLEGTMWIDQLNGRFTRAEGTLVRGVDFGWGIFGHLDKGGHFSIEQTEVYPGMWRITDLNINFKGTMLLFKTLNIMEHEHSFRFYPVPNHLSLADAVEKLRQEPSPPLAEPTRHNHKAPRTVSTGHAAPIATL